MRQLAAVFGVPKSAAARVVEVWDRRWRYGPAPGSRVVRC
ncbi:hypothetical protein DFR75_1011932 [Nocardia ignorata]|uniref:Helix-turn-helix protein n=1 Tax=Nocardia ignorata TaxID=145285 RepID=A0A4R6PVS3_NOCIG|nr:hypothetical protein DFR75_1011932 [Nocardia ignorata]